MALPAIFEEMQLGHAFNSVPRLQAETIQLELEQANERIAELTTELTAIKDEISGKVDPESGAVNSIQMKQMQAENARMREALVKYVTIKYHS